jgi:hypothetical protein
MYSRGFRRRDSLTRFVSEELGERGKSPVRCSVVQWFSGMLFCVAGSAIYNTKLFGFQMKQEGGLNR